MVQSETARAASGSRGAPFPSTLGVFRWLCGGPPCSGVGVRLRFALVPWLLLGCGARTSIDLPGAEAAPAPALGPVCGGDLPIETAYLGSPGDACGMAPTVEGAALIALADFTVWGARGDDAASITELFEGEPREGLGLGHGVVVTRGAFAAVAAVGYRAEGEDAHIELVLLRRTTSEVLHRARWTLPYQNFGNELRVFGNERGLFVVGVRLGDGIVTHVIDVTGRAFASAAGVLPIGDPDVAGHVPVVDETLSPERPTRWLDPCTGTQTAVLGPSAAGLTTSDGALVGFDPEGPAVVVASSVTARRFALPPDITGLFELSRAGKALLSTTVPTGFAVLDLSTGELRRLTVVVPAGLVRYGSFASFEGYDAGAKELVLTSSGGLLLPLRDAAEGYVYASQDGSGWAPLGAPVGAIYRAYVAEAGGTVLHFGNDFATELPPWEPPPPQSGRIDGMSLQAIRPESGVQAEFPASNTRYYALTADGGCLGVAVEGQVMTLSLADGTLRNYVIGAATWNGVDAFAFAAPAGTTLLAQ